jgi:FkbM family methyltransferase
MSEADILTALAQLNRSMAQLMMAERFKALGPEAVKEIWFDNLSVRMHLPDALDDRIQSLLLSQGRFFEEPLLRKARRWISSGAHVVDVGANMGNHTLFFLAVCGAAHVTSFEPQQRLTQIIRKNLELNGIEAGRSRIVQSGCGAVDGNLSVVSGHIGNLGATQFRYDQGGAFPVVRLDSCGIEQVQLLKIDAERMGDEVLKGGEALIRRCRPTIWIELYDGERERAMAWLSGAGYVLAEQMTPADHLFRPAG